MEPRQFARLEQGVAPERWVKSACGICSVGCGIEIGVRQGRIVGVRGREDHPVGRGRLGPKGLGQWLANHHRARARYPMIRGRDGRLLRASWDDAMELVVDQCRELLLTEGPQAIAFYNSGQLLLEEYYALGKIARAGLGTPNIDANTRLCTATVAASLMESFGADGPPGCYADFDATECIVLVGHNAAEQSTVLWMRILQAKAGPRKPKVIVIDPRRTLTVASGADLHLQLRPGTNVALLDGICRELVHHGWIDRDFIDRHCADFDEFRAIVEPYTPERVEEITGVPAAQLRRAAEWIGTSRSTVTTCLQGVYQTNQATAAACLVNSMHLIMGKIGKPGSAPFQFAGQPSSMNTRETGADGAYPGYRNWEDPRDMKELAERWNVPVELLGQKPVSAPEIFDLVQEGQVKLLWNVCTNPAVSMVDRGKQLRALGDVFLVVQDAFVDVETATLADVFLPAAIWGEKTGCMTSAERRCTLLEKAVEPPGEARADFDILVDFAARMDLRDRDGKPLVGFRTPEQAFEEWRGISRGRICDYSGMSHAKLRARGGIQWPCDDEAPEGTERLYVRPEFPTHWRVAESYDKDLRTGRDHTLEEYQRAHDLKGKARLIAETWQPPVDGTNDEYPLRAISGRQVYHWHTRTKTQRDPMLDDAAPEVFVALNAADAARLGIADGDAVRVTSRRGAMTGPAKVGDVVPAGVVFIPFHYGRLDRETNPNALAPRAWDPVSKQPLHKGAAVRVEKARADEAPLPWWGDRAAADAPPGEEARA